MISNDLHVTLLEIASQPTVTAEPTRRAKMKASCWISHTDTVVKGCLHTLTPYIFMRSPQVHVSGIENTQE